MSGVISGIGKVFKTIVVKPIKFSLKMDHKVAMKIWHTPILRYAAIAVAAYFTAGAAMGWFGAAGATGGTAAAGAGAAAAGGTAATAGAAGSFFAGQAVGAGIAGATTLGTVSVAGGAVAGGASVAGSIAAASVGAAAGAAVANSAGSTASAAMTNGAGSVTAVTGGAPVTTLGAVNVTAPAAAGGSGLSTIGADAVGSGIMAGAQSAFSDPNATQGNSVDANGNPATVDKVAQGDSLWSRGVHGVENMFSKVFHGGAPAAAGSAPAAGGVSTAKLMLIQGGLQLASAMLQKPQAQMQYAGVNAKGNGPGINIHTINGGFGLATGGQGEPAPGGVPNSLRPPGMSAGDYTGASLSNAALGGQQGQQGNLGQTAANTVGVGGLVPQGAVNYMGQ